MHYLFKSNSTTELNSEPQLYTYSAPPVTR